MLYHHQHQRAMVARGSTSFSLVLSYTSSRSLLACSRVTAATAVLLPPLRPVHRHLYPCASSQLHFRRFLSSSSTSSSSNSASGGGNSTGSSNVKTTTTSSATTSATTTTTNNNNKIIQDSFSSLLKGKMANSSPAGGHGGGSGNSPPSNWTMPPRPSSTVFPSRGPGLPTKGDNTNSTNANNPLSFLPGNNANQQGKKPWFSYVPNQGQNKDGGEVAGGETKGSGGMGGAGKTSGQGNQIPQFQDMIAKLLNKNKVSRDYVGNGMNNPGTNSNNNSFNPSDFKPWNRSLPGNTTAAKDPSTSRVDFDRIFSRASNPGSNSQRLLREVENLNRNAQGAINQRHRSGANTNYNNNNDYNSRTGQQSPPHLSNNRFSPPGSATGNASGASDRGSASDSSSWFFSDSKRDWAADVDRSKRPHFGRLDPRQQQMQQQQRGTDDRPGGFVNKRTLRMRRKRRLEALKSMTKYVPVRGRQTVNELSQAMGIAVKSIVATLKELDDVKRDAKSFVSVEQAEIVVREFGMIPEDDKAKEAREHGEKAGGKKGGSTGAEEVAEVDKTGWVQRPPVLCIMGHVDHGKTTLLDALRGANVADNEAGKITQSIGAFRVPLVSKDEGEDEDDEEEGAKGAKGSKVKKPAVKSGRIDDSTVPFCTILDTPGHAAFKAMRSRGANANLTDMIVLVVSAADSVQQQTIEAITLAKKSNLPIVVAVNKCDIPGVNPTKVLQELSYYGVVCEEMGGEVLSVEISAKEKTGLDDLVDSIRLMAEMMDLLVPPPSKVGGGANGGKNNKASAATVAKGGHLANQAFIVEALMQKGAGPILNCIVRSGMLKQGDYFVSGLEWGRIKQIMDDARKPILSAQVSVPCQIIGAKGIELVGDSVDIVESEKAAKELTEKRRQELELQHVFENEEEERKNPTKKNAQNRKVWFIKSEGQQLRRSRTLGPTELSAEAASKQQFEEERTLYCMVKADVVGSLEALLDYAAALPDDEVALKVLKTGVGDITEADIAYCAQNGTSVYGFNVKATTKIAQIAKEANVSLYTDSVIFHVFDEIRTNLSTLLPKQEKVVVSGVAAVLDIFPLKGKDEVVAGCLVTSGMLELEHKQFRVKRSDEIIFTGVASSIRHFKDEVKKVEKGKECGVILEGFMDIKKDDVLECFAKVSENRQIDDLSARGFMDDKKFIQTAMQEISLADAENEKNAANGSGTGASQRQQSRTFGARNVGGTNKWRK